MACIQRARAIPVLLGLIVLGATAALKLGVRPSHAAVSPTMHAFVHQDNSIGLTFDDGSAVGNQDRNPPTIPPGTYTIRVVDDASIHNFHLSGPGVDMATPTGESATPTWTVTFQPGGSYTFWCDSHPDFMYGVFHTSGAGSSSGSSSSGSSSSSSSSSSSGNTSSAKTSTLLGTLTGTLSSNVKPTLKSNGKTVSTLEAGRYRFAITDRDPKGSFTIQAIRKRPTILTGAAFVGTHTVVVTLTAGQWIFFSSAGMTSKSSFIVVA